MLATWVLQRRGRKGLQVELAVLGPIDERIPLATGEDQHGAGGVLAVAHGDRVADERDFDTHVRVPATAAALAPLGICQVEIVALVIAQLFFHVILHHLHASPVASQEILS